MNRSTPSTPPYSLQIRSVAAAYGLWCLGLFGLCGVHRFYLRKPVSGLMWLVTFGLFGLGQFIDLFLIPSMVREFNLREIGLYNQAVGQSSAPTATVDRSSATLTGQALMRRILQLASERQGVLAPAEAIAAIDGADFDDIEQAFRELERRGYALSENNIVTGAVQYRFTQLESR